jgi:hypothetical protein
LANITCVSNSKADPNDIVKKCFSSLSPVLPQPSAMFEGIEMALR